MVTVRLVYHEILDKNFTAVSAQILSDAEVLAEYRNFDPEKVAKEIYANQAEQFALPDEGTARIFLESSAAYLLVT